MLAPYGKILSVIGKEKFNLKGGKFYEKRNFTSSI